MATTPPPAKATPKGGGSGLSKKYGGVPMYVYVLAGLGIVAGVYYVRKKNAAAPAPAAGQPGSTGGAGVATTPYGPSGGQGIGTDTLAALLASQGAGATSATTSTFTPPAGEQQSGGGFAPAGGITSANASAPITSASGASYVYVPEGTAVQGQQYYYQPAPGIFSPIPAGGGGLPASTPWYLPISASS